MNEIMTSKSNLSLQKYRFTAEEYHRMGDAVIIAADRRVELINGEIIERSPINSLHAGTAKLLNRLLNNTLQGQVIISVHNPVALNEYSEPEPDLAVLAYRADMYTKAHPTPAEILLVIEVADTSPA